MAHDQIGDRHPQPHLGNSWFSEYVTTFMALVTFLVSFDGLIIMIHLIGDGTLYQSDVWVYTPSSTTAGTWQWVGGDIPVSGASNGVRGQYGTTYSFGGRLWPVLAIDGNAHSLHPPSHLFVDRSID